MGDQLAIVAEGLSKYFGPVRALDGVDLEQPAGTVLGMLGPNGAGKTTTVPACCSKLTRSRAQCTPNRFDKPSTAIARCSAIPAS